MSHNEYFGHKLKAIRKKRNITQSELAKICGINQTQITRYENGKNLPTKRIVKKIAEGLNIPIDTFSEVNEIPNKSLDEDYMRLRDSLSDPKQKLALRILLRSFYLSAKTKLVFEDTFNG